MRNLWLAGATLALTACSAAQDMGAADEQVTAFHSAYDAGQYGRIWSQSAPMMQQITPREQFLELMEHVKGRLGAVRSSSRTGFNVNYATEGSQVTLTYTTVFANGEGTETFIFDTADPPKLIGWHVTSPALFAPAPVPVAAEKADAAD